MPDAGLQHHKYDLALMRPVAAAGAQEIGDAFGIKTIYGWRPVDLFPDHPTGHAADFVISDLDNGHAVGQAVADYVVANAARLGVKYLIWNRQSWNPTRGTWEHYDSTDNPHTDHVHVTFLDTAGGGPPVGGPTLTPVLNPLDDLVSKLPVLKQLEKLGTVLADAGFWRRLGVGTFAVFLLLVGIAFINRHRIATATKAAVKVGKVAAIL